MTEKRRKTKRAKAPSRAGDEFRAELLTALAPLALNAVVALLTPPRRATTAASSDDADRAYYLGYADGKAHVITYVPVPQSECRCSACSALSLYADKLGRGQSTRVQ